MIKAANELYSLLPNWLPRLRWMKRFPVLRTIYWRARQVYSRVELPVRAKLHGYNVLVNPGNNYCFIIQETPLFNAPLVQLVHQMSNAKQRSLIFVDVGAATGDTVLLLKRRCPDAVSRFYCVEGDDEFFILLQENMQQFQNVAIVKNVLSREPTRVPSLVKHHAGTAAAMGDNWVDAVPLDSLEILRGATIDILKVDVDGFDGEVIAGATNTIRRNHPVVIFEWHPKLILATGCDPYRGFETLANCNYNKFLWFNNVGTFSHFTGACDRGGLNKMKELLLAVNHRRDEHFDVIGLHSTSELDEIELAALSYAFKKY
jgi:FkbM family methyltransferase